MKAQHIVQVSSYYPPHVGGQENAVYGLAQQLARSGHHVTVVTSAQGSKPGEKIEDGVHVQRLPSLVFGHAPIMPWFLPSLLGLLKTTTLVHLHIGQAFTPEIVWLASRIGGFKYIAQLHIDFEPSGPVGILLPFYKRAVLKRVLQSAAAVITLNQETLRTVRRVYDYSGRALIMHNGLDESFFALQRLPFARIPPHILRLLFVGRFSKQKNIIALLEALALTSRKVHLDIVGDGAEREAAQATIKRLGLKNVTLHGHLGRRKVMQFYATCNVLVMPSLYEAQPMVLLEAMAARIPIIGTRVIGVEEHIKDVGIVVEPTPQGLASGIEQYDSQYHLLPAMVEKGYDIACEHRWPQTLKKYEALYEEVLGH